MYARTHLQHIEEINEINHYINEKNEMMENFRPGPGGRDRDIIKIYLGQVIAKGEDMTDIIIVGDLVKTNNIVVQVAKKDDAGQLYDNFGNLLDKKTISAIYIDEYTKYKLAAEMNYKLGWWIIC